MLRSLLPLMMSITAISAAEYRLVPVAEHHGLGSFQIQEPSRVSEAIVGRLSVAPGGVFSLEGNRLSMSAPITIFSGQLQQPAPQQVGKLSVPYQAQFVGTELPWSITVQAINGEPEALPISRTAVHAMSASMSVSIGKPGTKGALMYQIAGKVIYLTENALPNPRLIVGLRLTLPGADAGKVAGKKEKVPRLPEAVDVEIDLVAIGD